MGRTEPVVQTRVTSMNEAPPGFPARACTCVLPSLEMGLFQTGPASPTKINGPQKYGCLYFSFVCWSFMNSNWA